MKNENSSLSLLTAIGGIDEKLISEAVKTPKRKLYAKALALVAALLICTLLLVPLINTLDRFISKGDDALSPGLDFGSSVNQDKEATGKPNDENVQADENNNRGEVAEGILQLDFVEDSENNEPELAPSLILIPGESKFISQAEGIIILKINRELSPKISGAAAVKSALCSGGETVITLGEFGDSFTLSLGRISVSFELQDDIYLAVVK